MEIHKLALALIFFSPPSFHSPHSRVEGCDGPGEGKHIVFLAGDQKYRSEETLPALARIVAKNFGFQCTALFSIDQATGEIVAGNSNMPGMRRESKA
jgi:hypothetical protein